MIVLENLYKNKYLKYKNKYLYLKNLMNGGASVAVPAIEVVHVEEAIELLSGKPIYAVTYNNYKLTKKYTLNCPSDKVHDVSVLICKSNNKEILCESCRTKVIDKEGENKHYWRCNICCVNMCTICFQDIKNYYYNEHYLQKHMELQSGRNSMFKRKFTDANDPISDLGHHNSANQQKSPDDGSELETFLY